MQLVALSLALAPLALAQSAAPLAARAITTNTVSALPTLSIATPASGDQPDTATAVLLGTNDIFNPQSTDFATAYTYTSSLLAAAPAATYAPEVDVYTVLADTTGTSQLAAGNDGNLYLVGYNASAQPGVNFLAADGVITADEQGRFFNYYLNEWAAYNVSRLRLNDFAQTPLGTRMTTLVPFAGDADTDPNLYAPVDTAGTLGYLAVCNIFGSVSKIFMVADYDAAMTTLASPALQNTLVGGVVSECAPLLLTSGTSGTVGF